MICSSNKKFVGTQRDEFLNLQYISKSETNNHPILHTLANYLILTYHIIMHVQCCEHLGRQSLLFFSKVNL